MAFVKLDCGLLNSTLWFDREAREVFITALLMAVPWETTKPEPQIQIRSLKTTGWSVPPGWYGFVHAAGVGIVNRSGIDPNLGLKALERLGAPEADSRTQDFEGRRLVRVNGGFIVLNYMKYRDRDHSSAERSRRYRERKKSSASTPSRVASTPSRVISRDATQADADADAEKSTTGVFNLAPYIDLHRSVTDGDPETGKMARPLKALEKRHGRAVVLAHLETALRSHRQQGRLQFFTYSGFASSFGQWNGTPPAKADRLTASMQGKDFGK